MSEITRDELIQLLTQLAARDLQAGASIYDHPCSVAIREIQSLDAEANKWATAYRQAKESAQETQSQLTAANARVERLEDRLLRSGFVRCDLPACNCGSWHQRYGLPERMAEIRATLTDAGHPPCNDNGNLISNALNELIQENDELRSRNHEAREIYTGMEGFVPETAPEGYCLRIIEQMYKALLEQEKGDE